jgi:hypothetical protein
MRAGGLLEGLLGGLGEGLLDGLLQAMVWQSASKAKQATSNFEALVTSNMAKSSSEVINTLLKGLAPRVQNLEQVGKLLLLFLILLTAAPVWAEPLPAGIEQGYSALTQAWTQRDADAVLSQFTSDAQIMDSRHRLLKHNALEKLVRHDLEGAESCKIVYKVLRWEKKDGHILVNSHQDRDIQYPTKRVLRVSERKDTWTQDANGKWKVSYVLFVTQNSSVEMKLDRPKK